MFRKISDFLRSSFQKTHLILNIYGNGNGERFRHVVEILSSSSFYSDSSRAADAGYGVRY